MADVKSKHEITRRRVVFSIEAAEAEAVTLMGDFNNWNPKKHTMENDGNGTWSKTVILPPGRYEYKFLIDGDWKEDPRNDETCSNAFGTLNSVFNVPAAY